MKLKVLDLFSGIGGFSLGLERTGGFETVAFCEIEEFPRKVLAKHWPKVPCFNDVRKLRGEHVGSVDVICGGFPCQDISTAGLGAGLDGARSGLWSEIARLVSELRPKFLIVENVAALLSRGLDRVLGDLAKIGYDAEWHCIPAFAVGAPHRRDRIWIVAYPNESLFEGGMDARTSVQATARGKVRDAEKGQASDRQRLRTELSPSCEVLAHTASIRQQGQGKSIIASYCEANGEGKAVDVISSRFGDFWSIEPKLGRVANGVPNRMDRLKSLGNSVVPQIPEFIGLAIMWATNDPESTP